MIAFFIIIAIIALIAIWLIGGYNGMIRSRNQVEEAFSTMDVYLKKRFDLVPNLVETVKGYAKHEKETLDAVITARNAAGNAGNMDERIEGEAQLSGALRSVFALAESYPDLKANTNFLDLQGQLKKIEEDIANSRKYYNGTVRAYNDRIMVFPASMIAGMFHFEKKPMFEVADAAERENIKVSF